tara:strand:+ start:3107 stop:4375 length:1269 start_codon:yes stop_codon:yes gene_type:complete
MAVASSESLDEFPRKPIKIIVPFGPGGASDTLARIVQEAIRRDELATEPLVIINVPGAGGTIGSRRAKNARPDGYTILNLHDGLLTAKHTGHDYGAEEFIPIASTGSSHTVVCTGPKGKWSDLNKLLLEARERPGELKFGMNLGAPSHFVGLQLQETMEGASFGMIPLQGGADRFEKLVGGHIDLSIFSVSEYLQFRMTDRRPDGLRAIAYLGPERHPQLAGTPTGREVGIDLVTGTTQFWWAPKGTPTERIQKLGDILEAAMESEWLQSRYRQKSVEPICLRGEPLAKLIAEKEAELASLNVGDLSTAGGKVEMVRFVCGGVILFGLSAVLLGLMAPGVDLMANLALNRRSWLVVGVFLGYLAILQTRLVPFWLVTILFIGGLGWSLAPNLRSGKIAIAWSVILGLGLQVLFQRILIIDLP